MFQYMACGKHFLIETQDSQSVEENARKQLSHELSAEDAEKPEEVGNHVTIRSVIGDLKNFLVTCNQQHIS